MRASLGAVLALGLGFSVCTAEDVPVVSPEVAGWVEKLGDPDAAVREEAVRKLVEIGALAIAPVAAAANSENLEKISRCISVLAELRKSKDETVQKSAEESLKMLAQSDNKSLARRAQTAAGIRKTASTPPLPGVFVVNRVVNGRVTMRNVNGDIEVDATEGQKKIKISKKATGEIEMVVNETDANGKVTGSKYTAKDSDELKKNHSEAAKLYEKYMAAQPRVNLVVNGGLIQLGAINRMPRILNPLELQRLGHDLAQARAELAKVQETLKGFAKEGGKADELQALAKDLDAAIGRVDEAQNRLKSP